MEIVIDLSKIGVIVVREINDGDKKDDYDRNSDFWFKTPFGNVLYACGLDQLRVLLGMVREIERQLIGDWIDSIERICEMNREGLKFSISYDGKVGRVIGWLPDEHEAAKYDDLSQLLTHLQALSPSP
ncbi:MULTISPECIES: hypothetical protein [Brucella]|uniref:hypothetical protein n=1 Tax=Brucella TaxID=234 RepID=UPI00124D6FC0|nr:MULTISPECIES: hypothetical protein [Brucella]KAB2747894.1 hypothetical protein F9L05_14755 [Brucella anthropi]CAB4325366.1 hypothetical protein BCH_00616 [Brucella sp. 191011898]